MALYINNLFPIITTENFVQLLSLHFSLLNNCTLNAVYYFICIIYTSTKGYEQ